MKSFLFFKDVEDLALGKIESEYRGTTEHIAEALNNTDEDIERFILYIMERDEPIRQKVLEFGIDKLLGVYLSIAEGGVSVSIKSKEYLLVGLRTAVTRLLYEAKKKFDIQVSIEFASRYKYWDESTGFPYLLSTFVEDDDQAKELLKPTKYPGIAKELSPWISGADDKTLEEIIVNKGLPDGVSKPRWIGGQADAFRMMDWLGMVYPVDFKACFAISELKVKNKPEKGVTPARGSIHYTLKTIQL